jgi:hypothetical protein
MTISPPLTIWEAALTRGLATEWGMAKVTSIQFVGRAWSLFLLSNLGTYLLNNTSIQKVHGD